MNLLSFTIFFFMHSLLCCQNDDFLIIINQVNRSKRTKYISKFALYKLILLLTSM